MKACSLGSEHDAGAGRIRAIADGLRGGLDDLGDDCESAIFEAGRRVNDSEVTTALPDAERKLAGIDSSKIGNIPRLQLQDAIEPGEFRGRNAA